MWPEIAALPAVIGFVGNRHGRNAHWVRRLANVEDPDVAQAEFAIGEIGLVGDDEQIAIGQRQWRMRAAAERRGPRWGKKKFCLFSVCGNPPPPYPPAPPAPNGTTRGPNKVTPQTHGLLPGVCAHR